MHSKIVNKTRYVDPEKIMKQTSSTVKNLGGGGRTFSKSNPL